MHAQRRAYNCGGTNDRETVRTPPGRCPAPHGGHHVHAPPRPRRRVPGLRRWLRRCAVRNGRQTRRLLPTPPP